MDIFQTRRKRLNIILTKMTLTELSKRSGVAASSISSSLRELKDGKYLRNIGELTARKLEHGAGLGRGWLDDESGDIGLPESVSEIDFSIPLLSWARAGAFCEAAGQFTLEDAEEMLPRPLQSMGKNTFALTVRGDSMDMPDGYREGEIVYIDPAIGPTPGRDVLAKTDAGYTLKRYKEDESGPYLLQLNGNKIIRPDTPWSVCGVVVFSGRKR